MEILLNAVLGVLSINFRYCAASLEAVRDSHTPSSFGVCAVERRHLSQTVQFNLLFVTRAKNIETSI